MSHHVLKFTSSVLSLFFVFHFLWIFVSYFVEVCLSHFNEERRGTYVPKVPKGYRRKRSIRLKSCDLMVFRILFFIFSGKSRKGGKFYASFGGGSMIIQRHPV